MTHHPGWRYRVLACVVSVPWLLLTLWQGFRAGSLRFILERLSYFHRSTSAELMEARNTLWVHAASVGEVLTVLPLLQAWHQKNPTRNVLVTTNTVTGAAVLADKAPQFTHCFLPLDLGTLCQRFLQHHKIQVGWIVETEIWPWLYATCRTHGIPLTIVNGRLSQRSLRIKDSALAITWQRALADINVLARTTVDADRYVALGAAVANTEVIGNLKFAANVQPPEAHPIEGRAYILLASTHANEETLLIDAWLQSLTERQAITPSAQHDIPLLVIAPRHPNRGDGLMQELTARITAFDSTQTISQRSKDQQPAPYELVYLADTLGEMPAWYQSANAVFIGGSLISRGGHNMLEPAKLGCAIVVGPNTENFADIMACLQPADAIVVAESAHSVIASLWQWLDDPSAAIAIGQRAMQASQQADDVIDHYLEKL